MNKSFTFGLLLCIVLVIAPHTAHLPVWVSALCFSLLSWRGYLTYTGNPLPKRWLLLLITIASVTAITTSFNTLFGREVGVTLLMMLATLKLMELKQARDAMVVIYLCCFIIITNFFYSQSISTALYLFATLMVIVTTWIQLQAQDLPLKVRLRVAASLLLQAIPLMLILFVLFPRIDGPLWGLPQDAHATSGLDDKMSPGSLSRLSLSEAVAFRVSYVDKVPRRDQMYWRGPVLWDFDGRTWTSNNTLLQFEPEFTELDQEIAYTVTLEPHNKKWLFALDVPNRISTAATLTFDFQLLRNKPINTRLRYSARSNLVYQANLRESPRVLQRALRLPDNLNPRTMQLAAEWRSKNSDDASIVRTALAYFNREKFEYTLEPPLLGNNGVDEFLFSTKQGFCEHYSSAFVVLMRAADIPARVVTGYQGGEFNEIGNYYIVRQSDAHAWAEVWLEDQGWVRVDPTAAISPDRVSLGLSAAISDNAALPFMARNPPQWLRDMRLNWDALSNQWNQWVLGYDSELQFAFMRRLGMESITWQNIAINMMAAIGLMIAIYALYMLRHLMKRRSDQVQAAWLKLCHKLAKAGLPRSDHEGPQDYAVRISSERPDLSVTFTDLAQCYTTLRYGNSDDEQTIRDFQKRVASFKP